MFIRELVDEPLLSGIGLYFCISCLFKDLEPFLADRCAGGCNAEFVLTQYIIDKADALTRDRKVSAVRHQVAHFLTAWSA